MRTGRKTPELTIDQAAQHARDALAGLDDAREAGLRGLGRIRAKQTGGLARELERLEARGGAGVRVAELRHRLDANRELVSQLAREHARAETGAPQRDADAWVLQGRVLDTWGHGQADLTVTLHDAKGQRLDRFGWSCTDAAGRFRLEIRREGRGSPDEPPPPLGTRRDPAGDERDPDRTERPDDERDAQAPRVYAHVTGSQARRLHADTRGLAPRPGRVDYIEIVLGESEGRCEPPAGQDDPTQRRG